MPTVAPSSSAVKRFMTLTPQMKLHFAVCQRTVGKPLTREEAQQKLDANPRFQSLALRIREEVHGSNERSRDLVQDAIGLEYGSRLRSCVEESNAVRNHVNHSFN